MDNGRLWLRGQVITCPGRMSDTGAGAAGMCRRRSAASRTASMEPKTANCWTSLPRSSAQRSKARGSEPKSACRMPHRFSMYAVWRALCLYPHRQGEFGLWGLA